MSLYQFFLQWKCVVVYVFTLKCLVSFSFVGFDQCQVLAGKGYLALTTWSWLVCCYWLLRNVTKSVIRWIVKKNSIKCLQYFSCSSVICNGLFSARTSRVFCPFWIFFPYSKQRKAGLDWYDFPCFGSPTALSASQRGLFRAMWSDRAKGLLFLQFPGISPLPIPQKCWQNTLNGHMRAFGRFLTPLLL